MLSIANCYFLHPLPTESCLLRSKSVLAWHNSVQDMKKLSVYKSKANLLLNFLQNTLLIWAAQFSHTFWCSQANCEIWSLQHFLSLHWGLLRVGHARFSSSRNKQWLSIAALKLEDQHACTLIPRGKLACFATEGKNKTIQSVQ